ncbi:MAG: 4-alpha-glucanotransferase [Clostridia bacterium]|nr:4-alpha-glucanotransferase [Clostridia bacterium]
MKRASGVLMHLSSLYGNYSIGSFGKESKEFVDFLAKGGFTYWQVLPFCMADDCHSPYKSYSAFGGNPLFIDLPTLAQRGLLTYGELKQAEQQSPYLCEYSRLEKERLPLLRLAASRISDGEREDIQKWLEEFPELAKAAEFLALCQKNQDRPWHDWTEQMPEPEELFFWQWIQHEFFHQWMEVKRYANKRGIQIIGDIPIYVALDSCDVWANPEQFQLDKNLRPTKVAGVPPDYFSEDGQLWGNPLYNWKQMRSDGYAWWSRRIEYMLTLFDGIRMDHFRGLEAYWSIPASAKTAKEGKWVRGPGRPLIDKIREIAGDRLIIAEDLGDITPGVEALLRHSKFPGMRVLQFAFLGDTESPHLPHNYPKNCVAYSGTHDNNTLLGYIWEMSPESRARLMSYCNCQKEDWRDGCEMIMKTLMASHADTVVFPIQDIFAYGADTRMNTPGTATNNWAYRITREQLAAVNTEKFRFYNELYGRF